MDARIRHGVYAAPLRSSAMDHKAALLALVLVSGSLAGCTGDPDEGGNDEFDSEALQDLIDQNLQDFINNTSVTVYQEIHHHYHNNTTIDNTDNSVSNVNGSGAGSGSMLHMFTVDWSDEYYLDYDILNHTLQNIDNASNLSSTGGNLTPKDLVELQNEGFVRIYAAPWRWAPMYGKHGVFGFVLLFVRILRMMLWRSSRLFQSLFSAPIPAAAAARPRRGPGRARPHRRRR